jgi:hypothetical protein
VKELSKKMGIENEKAKDLLRQNGWNVERALTSIPENRNLDDSENSEYGTKCNFYYFCF